MVTGRSPSYPADSRPAPMLPGQLIACALLVACTCGPLLAQQPSQHIPLNAATNDIEMRRLTDLWNQIDQGNSSVATPTQRPPDACIMQPYPGMPNTVSVRSLAVPDKAQSEYQKACTALEAHKLTASEKHLRKALQIDSFDAVGWVMLGRVLLAEDQLDQASDACSHAVVRDPSYWPAELCLAEIDGREEKWTNSLAECNRTVSLNLGSKKVAYYVSAIALFNLDKVGDAESRALEAEQLDRDHQMPPLQLLLAKIDERKGDISGAVTHLRECQKYAKDSLQADLAKKELARLEPKPK